MLQGIDVSHFQGSPNWSKLSFDGIVYAFCKASEGNTYVDPTFARNWADIKETGLIRGTYHFYVPGDDPITQAKHFMSVVGQIENDDLPAVLDLEKQTTMPAAQLQADVQKWLDYVEQQTAKKPIIYTNTPYGNQFFDNPAFAEYPLWLAQYTSRETPNLPKTWQEKGWAFWQKSDRKQLTGITQTYDYDLFNGDLSALLQFVTTSAIV